MPIGGYRREVDLTQLGPALLVASSLILAIRTARWKRIESGPAAAEEWNREVEQSVLIAHRIFAHLISKSPFLFAHRNVPLEEPDPADAGATS